MIILLLITTLLFGFALRRETARIDLTRPMLIYCDLSIAALAAVTTWHIILAVLPPE